ncbi:MAG: site-2 protease family protein [Candidatus Promineifilaceae bacterium]
MFDADPSAPFLSKTDLLVRNIEDLFLTSDITEDFLEKGQIRLRGQFLIELATHYDLLRARFEERGYTPLIRQEDEPQPFILAIPHVFKAKPERWQINLVLFLLTILSTLFVGASSDSMPESSGVAGIVTWLLTGWPFSLSMLLILGAHELGHYFAARYHNIDASLPYFIPFPTIIGTMGAVIVQREPAKNKRVLMDVGAAGPLAGLVFAIPILFIGLATSSVGPLPTTDYLLEGNSIVYALAKMLVFGEFLPANGLDVSVNQVAWAGWAGLLVTAINLMPVGQLDGGHMAYVLFGNAAQRFRFPFIIVLALLSAFLNAGWWLWIGMLWFFGKTHATPLDDVTPLDPRRRAVAIFCLVLFIFLFVPSPITPITP